MVGGVDAEVEVYGEEEVQLQRVELGEGDAADPRPSMEEVKTVEAMNCESMCNSVQGSIFQLNNCKSVYAI